MTAAELMISSERGVECPHCGHEHCDPQALSLLVPGVPIEWDCDACDRTILVTKLQPAPVYLAERIEEGAPDHAR